MDSREIVRRTLTFQSPPRIPRQIWVLPWAEEKYPQDLQKLRYNFPDDLLTAPVLYTQPLGIKGDRYSPGVYVDEWGCTFENLQSGTIGVVRKPLIADWKDLEKFEAPESVLNLDHEEINAFCKETDKFVLAGICQRPFERLQFIRTMEQSLIDLMEQPPELFELLHRIHQLYCKEVEVWASTDVDAVTLMDDWGSQKALIASPDIFRCLFKPMYRDYVEIARDHGKYIFMHSDGYILDIIPDLIELGIDALNSQVFCMGIEELGKRFRGRLTFWGEIDRQNLLPQGTRQEIEQAVYEVWTHLYEDGGIIAQCEFGLEAKPENIIAVFETWETISQSEMKSKP